MDNIIIQVIILLAGLAGWIFCSFPVLRYVIYWSEGSFRWPLLGWLLLMVLSIFLAKMSLFSLIGWPAPGTWTSRLFFPGLLFGSYFLPFIKEWIMFKMKSK